MKYLIFSLLIVLCGSVSITIGQTEYSPSLNLYVNQSTGSLWNSRSASLLDSMINNNLAQQMKMGRQALVSAIMEDAARKIEGEDKIRTGRATTRFTPISQNSLVERIAANAKTPQEKQEIKQSFDIALSTFNNILKAKRLTPYDAADGNALAFVLSYLVYKGEDPTDARLTKMRNLFRNEKLKNPLQQGTPDAENQRIYESRTFRSMLAVRAAQAAIKENSSVQEKQNARLTAKEYAAGVLKELWPSVPPERIILSNTTAWGFDETGSEIISNGKATVTFTRSNGILSAKEFAVQYNTNERKIENLMSDFDAEVKRRGGATNDLAWGAVTAFALAYEVYTDGKTKLNGQQLSWLLKEFGQDILSDSGFQSYSAQEKQKYYEGTAIRTMLIFDKYHQGKTSETKDEANAQLKEIFSPRKLEDFQLRANGFVKVR